MMDLSESLARTLLELVSIPSPTGDEKALCDAIEARIAARVGRAAVARDGHSLVVTAPRSRAPGSHPRIGLVGHLDTVRTHQDGPPRSEGGRLYGAGAADMKSGLAVMIELLERLPFECLPVDVVFVFYEREEGPYVENRLGPLLERFEVLRRLDLAICPEPSDNKLQLGCMGSLQATVTFTGRTAHSARPWQGDNAFYKAAPFLAALALREPRDVSLDGMLYREVISPTLAHGGRARNVIPDSFELNVNSRFSPGRTGQEALEEVRQLAGPGATVSIADLAPPAHPHRTHPLIERLVACGVTTVEPKQAWTDVARFDALAIAAVNFGPGTQAQAHQPNEFTELTPLVEGYAILARFLGEDPAFAWLV